MTPLQDLYSLASKENIIIDKLRLRKRDAFSLMDDDGDCYIAIDPYKITSQADERTKLVHEMGHCITGSFYNQWAQCDVRKKHENQADRWGILKLITVDDLDDAVALGHTDIWDLADHFGVTEDMMRKAVCLYTHGNLATELYF